MNTISPANKNGTKPSRMALANIARGRLEVPIKVTGYGPDGVGKSTWASGAPKPIWLPLDNRTAHLDIARFPQPATWDEALEALSTLELEKHDYQSLVIDPVSWLEPLVAIKVTGDPTLTLAEYKGGYGKGEQAAFGHWRVLVAQLERLWSKGMNVILLAHCSIKPFNDPQGPAYDRYELAMSKSAAGLIKQWSDYVLFMKHEASGSMDEKTKRARGIATGLRLVHTTWMAAHDAKFSGSAPEILPLSWEAFYGAVQASRGRARELRERIEELLAKLGPGESAARARAYVADAGDDVNKLDEIVNAIVVKLEQKPADASAKE
jgi:hypothetical protein